VANSDDSQTNNALRRTNTVLCIIFFLGLLFVFIHTGWEKETTTALLWELAGVCGGAIIGFLFGIPKVLQANKHDETTQPDEKRSGYSQQVNTNLTEISDWLTKIIVGLGLVNLKEMPARVSRWAEVIATGFSSTNPADEKSFALALLISTPIIGFFFGYLNTRLYLARVFGWADQAAAQSAINQIVKTEGQAVEQADSSKANLQPTERQLEAADKVAKLASQADLSDIRQQLLNLARSYETTRATSPSGSERTRKMQVIVAQMRTLALAAYSQLSEFANSSAPGDKLVAVAMLQVKANADYFDWLANCVITERPFIGYQASVALLFAARSLGSLYTDKMKAALDKALTSLADKKDTDRFEVLQDALNELTEHQ
jgi:hypothetical protein